MSRETDVNCELFLQNGLLEDEVFGQRRTPKPVPPSFGASFSQSRACLRSPEENEKTQRRGTTQTACRKIYSTPAKQHGAYGQGQTEI
ncbi:hypothetical protein AV530_002619 [Patagioenas fasciata monilis]|uniref:Uncharacterized protein n=1 Tax=Patagioenas fasciata monilis TaxID=372326 RepID=A0A1V4K738_PATFA|nr:hypothetical protein AV530_002619 [Patagioenas fasciata monilis]